MLELPIVTAALFFVSTIYAIVLDKNPAWYLPDRTWVTVVVGNSLIILALFALELWGTPLTIGHVVLMNVTAGAPIIIWQLIQVARRHGERAARGKKV